MKTSSQDEKYSSHFKSQIYDGIEQQKRIKSLIVTIHCIMIGPRNRCVDLYLLITEILQLKFRNDGFVFFFFFLQLFVKFLGSLS